MVTALIIVSLIALAAIVGFFVMANKYSLQKEITAMYEQKIKDLKEEKEKLQKQLKVSQTSSSSSSKTSSPYYPGH